MKAAMKGIVLGASIWLCAGEAAAQNGRWRTASGNVEVEIGPCGDKLCGTIDRVLSNRSMADPSLELPADVPGVGVKILRDFAASADGEWEGEIFNRENGKTYSCVMTLRGPDELEIRPYVGIRLIGRTQVWKRVAAQTAAGRVR